MNYGRYYRPTYTQSYSFSITFQAVETPYPQIAKLTVFNPDSVNNFQTVVSNTILVGTGPFVIDLFVVAENDDYLLYFDIYSQDRKTYIRNCFNLPHNETSYIPRVYSRDGDIPIYVIQQVNIPVFAYFRIRESKFFYYIY